MQMKLLGRSGLKVSKLCFGTLTMSPLQRNMSPEEGAKLLIHAYEKGVRFLDTADRYDFDTKTQSVHEVIVVFLSFFLGTNDQQIDDRDDRCNVKNCPYNTAHETTLLFNLITLYYILFLLTCPVIYFQFIKIRNDIVQKILYKTRQTDHFQWRYEFLPSNAEGNEDYGSW